MGCGLLPKMSMERRERPGNTYGQKQQTMRRPIVWLMQEKTNLAAPADVAQYSPLAAYRGKQRRDVWWPRGCQVFIERHNKRLIRWLVFLRTTPGVQEEIAPDGDGSI